MPYKIVQTIGRALFVAFLSLPGLGNAQALRLVTAEEPPTNYTHEGKLTGITVDIVHELLRRQGLDTPIELFPWARAYAIAQQGPNVAIFTAARTPEREALGFSFVGPVTTRKHALFARANDARHYRSLADLRNERPVIAGMRADWRARWVTDQSLALYATNSHRQSLVMLQAGRVDLAVLSDLELGPNLEAIGAPAGSVRLAYLIEERSAYILLSKGTEKATVMRWQNEFAQMQSTDFFNRLSSRWSTNLGLGLRYTRDKGIHIEPR